MKAAPPSLDNNGGIVAVLVLLAGSLAIGMIGALVLYVSRSVTLARLLSGWANIGNALVHLLLIVLLSSDPQRYIKAGINDADDMTGPVILMLINCSIGLRTLRGAGPNVAFGWNTFVAFAGSLVPLVWHTFFDVGLAAWPYPVVFIWLAIWAFESTALFSTCAWFALKDTKVD